MVLLRIIRGGSAVPVGFHLRKQLRTCTASNPAVVQLACSCAAETNGKAPALTFITTRSTSAGAPRDMKCSEDCISGNYFCTCEIEISALQCEANAKVSFVVLTKNAR